MRSFKAGWMRVVVLCCTVGVAAALGGCTDVREQLDRLAIKKQDPSSYPHPTEWKASHTQYMHDFVVARATTADGELAPSKNEKCASCHIKKNVGKPRKLTCAAACHQGEPPKNDGKPAKPSRVIDSECLNCHREYTQRDYGHYPAAAGLCNTCHEASSEHFNNPSSGKVTKVEGCYSCHEKVDLAKNKHAALDMGCVTCHDPHGSAYSDFFKKAPRELCMECHDDLLKKSPQHKSLGQNEKACLQCHVPHSSNEEKLIKRSKGNACIDCHIDFVDEVSKRKKVHYPMDAGLCDTCHQAKPEHFSAPQKGKNQVTKDNGENCYLCHTRMDKGEVKHAALEMGCASCHDPHGADHERYTKDKARALCVSCHGEQPTAKHATLRTDDLACVECHNPHSTKQPKLLKKERTETCLECHSDLVEEFGKKKNQHYPAASVVCDTCHVVKPEHFENPEKGTGQVATGESCYTCHDRMDKGSVKHAALEMGCSTCHEVHASENSKLTRKAGGALCADCHDQASPGAPHQGLGAMKRGCVECHAPHSAAKGKLLIKEEPDMCVTCHNQEIVLGQRKIPNVGEKIQLPFPHMPAQAGCSDCHFVHNRGKSGWLLKANFPTGSYNEYVPANGEDNIFQACFACHERDIADQGGSTGFRNEAAGKSMNLHWVHITNAFGTEPNRGFSCRVCHDPHGSHQQIMRDAWKINDKFEAKMEFKRVSDNATGLVRGTCAAPCHMGKDVKTYERAQ